MIKLFSRGYATTPCRVGPSVHNIYLQAAYALWLLSNCLRLDCCVSGLVMSAHPHLLKFILWLKLATSLPICRHEYEDRKAVVTGNEPLNGINSSFQTVALINNFNFLGVWQSVLFDRAQRRKGLVICQSVLTWLWWSTTYHPSAYAISIFCQYHLLVSSVNVICQHHLLVSSVKITSLRVRESTYIMKMKWVKIVAICAILLGKM